MNVTYPFISSPKRKFQVSFSDLIKICPLSVVVVINSSHFHLLLLQNHWADFNFTWHKVSLDEDNSNLELLIFFWGGGIFQKSFFLKTIWPEKLFVWKHLGRVGPQWGMKVITYFLLKNYIVLGQKIKSCGSILR